MNRARPLARGPRALLLSLLSLLFVGLPLIPLGAAAPSPAASGTPVTGSISGPAYVGVALKATYVVHAEGGPAMAPNGTQVGIYSFKASLVGLNTTAATVTPPEGVLVNGSITLQMIAPNVTEGLTLYVDVTSGYQGENQSTNLTWAIQVVVPITLSAGLQVLGPSAVKPFALTVQLDGAAVGTVNVPALTSGQSYPLSFSYVAQGLAPGWHTFTVSLAQEHGRVVFAGGGETYSASFYVAGPPPNNSIWYLAGASAFLGAVFIWATRVGGRRRPKPKG